MLKYILKIIVSFAVMSVIFAVVPAGFLNTVTDATGYMFTFLWALNPFIDINSLFTFLYYLVTITGYLLTFLIVMLVFGNDGP